MNKLLCFTAKWCAPCQSMKPKIEELSNEYPGRVINMDIDLIDKEFYKQKYKFKVVPTFVVVDEEELMLTRHIGDATKATLKYLLTSYDE